MATRPDPTPPVGTADPMVFTVEEAASQLRIGRSTMYELIATGEVGSITIGASRRIPAEDLRAYVASRRSAA